MRIVIIKLNGEKLKTILLKSRTGQVWPFSPYLPNLVLEGLARDISQLKEMKRTQIVKEYT